MGGSLHDELAVYCLWVEPWILIHFKSGQQRLWLICMPLWWPELFCPRINSLRITVSHCAGPMIENGIARVSEYIESTTKKSKKGGGLLAWKPPVVNVFAALMPHRDMVCWLDLLHGLRTNRIDEVWACIAILKEVSIFSFEDWWSSWGSLKSVMSGEGAYETYSWWWPSVGGL